jgi:HTH-type transcriptional regulator, bacterioopsin transcriptional activator and related proteins
LPIGVLVVEAGTRIISYISPDITRFLGRDLKGSRMGPVMDGLNLLNLDGSPLNQDEIPVFRSLGAGEAVIDAELILEMNGKYKLYVRMNSAPVRGPDGQIIAAVATIMNITERKATERRLTETTKLLQAALRASPLPINAIDMDGNVIIWNRAAERVFGYAEQEVIGRPLPTVQAGLGGELARIRALIMEGRTISGELVRRYRKDGTPVDVRIFMSPLLGEGDEMFGGLAVFELISPIRGPSA